MCLNNVKFAVWLCQNNLNSCLSCKRQVLHITKSIRAYSRDWFHFTAMADILPFTGIDTSLCFSLKASLLSDRWSALRSYAAREALPLILVFLFVARVSCARSTQIVQTRACSYLLFQPLSRDTPSCMTVANTFSCTPSRTAWCMPNEASMLSTTVIAVM